MAAALSFRSCYPPQIHHTQSNFTLSVRELHNKKPPIYLSKRYRFAITVTSSSVSESSGNTKPSSPAKKLREIIIQSPSVLQGPCCFDALSAKLIEQAGFPYCITNGFSISATRFGLPNTGLISYGETVDQSQQITQSISIPVIGDGCNGFGNVMNVKRTVKGYIKAGFAGIIINDLVSHETSVVSREESVMRIKAAVDARRESGYDIVIIAQTDSRETISLEESLVRARAFVDAGADVLCVESLVTIDEMKSFCNVYPLVPKMANMVESGGKIPILNPIELEEIGYKLVTYPISLIGVSIRAMQDALLAIKGGRIPPPGSMPCLDEIEKILGYDIYTEEVKRYAAKVSRSSLYGKEGMAQDNSEQRKDPTVEVMIPEVVYDKSRKQDPFTRIWSRSLRIKIIGRDGFEKLDVRIPAGFLEGVTNIVPALGGVNLKQLMDDATDEDGGKLLLDFKDTGGDRIQVFLE